MSSFVIFSEFNCTVYIVWQILLNKDVYLIKNGTFVKLINFRQDNDVNFFTCCSGQRFFEYAGNIMICNLNAVRSNHWDHRSHNKTRSTKEIRVPCIRDSQFPVYHVL